MNIAHGLIQILAEDSGPQPVVTVIGDLGYDYIYNTPTLEGGKEVIIRSSTRTIAGAAGYFACGMARLGARVFFVTDLGNDGDGRQLLEEINELGIDTEGIRLLDDRRSYFTLIFADEQESTPRQVATYLGPMADLTLKNFDTGRFIARSDLVYSCNYFLILTLREEIGGLFTEVQDQGKITAYDANAGDGWEDPQNLKLLQQIYPQTDIVFLNESEAECLTGERDPIRALAKASPKSEIVVIKLGARGVVLRHRDLIYCCSAFPLAEAVQDTVGAGDSFHAAFLYFYLEGFPVLHCAVLGAANAASTVLHPGGVRGQLNRRQLAEMLENYTIEVVKERNVEITLKG